MGKIDKDYKDNWMPAMVTPIKLRLAVRTGTGGRRNPFIVLCAI